MHYLDFLDLVEERFSVRSFTNEPVPENSLNRILHAAHMAPTAVNAQPQKLYVIQSREALEKLKICTPCHFNAPLAILVCYDRNESWRRPFDGQDSGFMDASIVATHMMLQVYTEGMGCTWVMHFNPDAIHEQFGIPEEHVPVCLLPMGFPGPKAKPASGHLSVRPMAENVFQL